jgi:Holliday junction resolvase-like predicted endonuclease
MLIQATLRLRSTKAAADDMSVVRREKQEDFVERAGLFLLARESRDRVDAGSDYVASFQPPRLQYRLPSGLAGYDCAYRSLLSCCLCRLD